MINEGTDATAVQAVNDLVAAGCAEVFITQNVRIPEEMSVVGFGNSVLGEHFRVPLTSTDQPKHRLGTMAVELMLQLLRGHRPEGKRLPAPVILRASSGTAPATPVLGRLKPLQK
jgi:LacI family transcriptional regulator